MKVPQPTGLRISRSNPWAFFVCRDLSISRLEFVNYAEAVY